MSGEPVSKAFYRVLILVILGFSMSTVRADSDSITPLPPAVESEIGYLQVMSGDVLIPPPLQRFFIPPQSRLAAFDSNSRELILAVPRDGGSLLCRIPRYAKYMILLDFNREKQEYYFRGAIEAETIPFPLKANEELPILSNTESGWLVQIHRNDLKLRLFIPDDVEDIRFSRESSFAKFAKSQAEKGLQWYDGEWLPAATVQNLRDAERLRIEKEEIHRKNVFQAAEAGVAVLKDGQVLLGQMRGRGGDKMLFSVDGRDHWLAPGDLAGLDYEQIIAKGRLTKADSLFKQARKNEKRDPGESVKMAEKVAALLAPIKEKTPAEYQEAEMMRQQAVVLAEDIENELNLQGKVIYEYAVFPRSVVDYHLQKGHILLNRRVWLEPQQLCRVCHGSGETICAKCDGRGQIRVSCPQCVEGRIPCSICLGTGLKDCPICHGSGQRSRKCRRCHGRGTILDIRSYSRYPGYYGTGPKIISGDGTTLVIHGYQPYPRCYGTYYARETCPRCDGSGKELVSCYTCSGRGKVSCPKTVKCSLCRGIGYSFKSCPECLGAGKTSCAVCEGKGYTGEAQKMPEVDILLEPGRPTTGAGGADGAVLAK